MKRRILAVALAAALSAGAAAGASAQVLTLTSGDMFSWVGRPYYLKYQETADDVHTFWTVGASGGWEPGLPYIAVYLSGLEFDQLFTSGQVAVFTGLPEETDPPETSLQLEPLVEEQPLSTTVTPEPVSLLLLGTGLAGLGGVARRKRRKS